MGEEVSFQLITRHVRPDFAGLLATLRKRVNKFEGGEGGRAFKHAEECKAAEMRCINSGKQRKFIYALSTVRYKLRASNGARLLFYFIRVKFLVPGCMHLFIPFSFLSGLQIIGERFNCKARLAMRHLSDDSLMESASNIYIERFFRSFSSSWYLIRHRYILNNSLNYLIFVAR